MPAPPLLPLAHTAPLPEAQISADGVRMLPDASSTPPVAVFLHGGGWRLGSRRSVGPAYAGRSPSPFAQLAAAGIAVASIDYRLSGEARWPAQLHDAKAAIRWLRARASDLGVDPDGIAAWGESSGGHLAALLGLTGPELEGEVGIVGPSSAVVAVVAWYPPTDLTSLPADLGADPLAPDSREALLLGAPLATVPDLAAEASPLTHLTPDAPTFLLLHGRAERLIPCVQSERLAAALAAAGNQVELETYLDTDHMWAGSSTSADRALDRTQQFLLQQLSV